MCKLVPYMNGNVADIKLQHIKNITRQAETCKNIHRIMLFGSAIEERCKKQSDIDIAVFGAKTRSKYLDSKEFHTFKTKLFQFDWDQEYDVLYYKDTAGMNDEFMKEIERGVEIYRRQPV